MSFYGSIYYQLVDAFSKIKLTNKGKNNVAFPKSTQEEYNENAAGRASQFHINTGNRWLNINRDSTDNSYSIWHSAPDTEKNNLNKFQALEYLSDKIPSGNEGEIVVISPGKYIKSGLINYDKAGHVSSIKDLYFTIEESQTDRDITDLTKRVKTLEENNSSNSGKIINLENSLSSKASTKVTNDLSENLKALTDSFNNHMEEYNSFVVDGIRSINDQITTLQNAVGSNTYLATSALKDIEKIKEYLSIE